MKRKQTKPKRKPQQEQECNYLAVQQEANNKANKLTKPTTSG
jgi:hypothetical protein